MTDIRELLPLYALGILDPAEAAVVERAVAADPVLAAELASYQDAAPALVPAVEPTPETHARLLASVGGGRFEAHAARMASLFDVSVDRARELLGLIERTASWHPQIPGVALVHFDGGPAYADADCGFIQLAPGGAFPPHHHVGEEVTVVLQGHMRDVASGRLLGPGDELAHAGGTDHQLLVCEGDEPCIYAARAMHGIEVAGAPARPSRTEL